MPASVVQIASKAVAQTYSYTVSLTGVQPGNPLLLCAGSYGFTNAYYLNSVAAPGYTWTKLIAQVDPNNGFAIAELWLGTGGAGGSVTVTATGTTTTGTPSGGGSVMELSGVDVSHIVTGFSQGASTTPTSANLSGGAGDLIVQFMFDANYPTTALPGAPWTNNQGMGNISLLSYQTTMASPGAVSCTISNSTNWVYVGTVIAARAAPTGSAALAGVAGLTVFAGPRSGILRYWDQSAGAYILLPGAGAQGVQGPTGPVGPVGPAGGQGPLFTLTWIPLPYAATWSDYAQGWRPGQYAIDSMGCVYLRGFCQSTTSTAVNGATVVANLPSGFRPVNNEMFAVLTWAWTNAGCVTRMNINPNGQVVINNSAPGATVNSNWLSLSGIQFIADGS